MHLYLFTGIPMAHVFSMARFRLGSHALRGDRGRWEGGQHISSEDRTCKRCNSPSLVDDEYHALFSFVLVLLASAKISLKSCSSVLQEALNFGSRH
jgi:hypothetical protein